MRLLNKLDLLYSETMAPAIQAHIELLTVPRVMWVNSTAKNKHESNMKDKLHPETCKPT